MGENALETSPMWIFSFVFIQVCEGLISPPQRGLSSPLYPQENIY